MAAHRRALDRKERLRKREIYHGEFFQPYGYALGVTSGRVNLRKKSNKQKAYSLAIVDSNSWRNDLLRRSKTGWYKLKVHKTRRGKVIFLQNYVKMSVWLGGRPLWQRGHRARSTRTDVNFRTGPSTSYSRLGQLQSRRRDHSGKERSWYKVTVVATGKTGLCLRYLCND
jgi:hypothetical protein